MDFSIFQPLLDHVEAHAVYYIVGAVVLLPLLYFTKRYSIPLILYAVEISIYLTVIHVVVHYIVAFLRWFKEQSEADPIKAGLVTYDWGTPMSKFWVREEYHPEFLFYMEVVFAVLILAAVLRFRPMKVQNVRKSRYFNSEAKEKKKKLPGYRDYSDLLDDDLPKDGKGGGKKGGGKRR